MKIVFVIDSLRRHGAQRFLTHLTRGLAELGYAQTVIVLNDVSEPDVEEELSSAGCSIITIGKRALLLGGIGWWRLVAMLRKSDPDILMTLLDVADTIGRPAAHLAGCKVLISSIRVRNVLKPAWQRWLDRKTVRWASKVIFNSGRIVPYAIENEAVRQEQVAVIPNGVDDWRTRSASLRNSARAEIGLTAEMFLLGVVSRFNPQKNIALVLEAASRLSDARPWKLLLLGDGPDRKKLRRLEVTLGLRERIIWLGERAELAPWYAAMDLFVHTADFEGMPNAVMEAMANGLPVVASDVDGTRDLIVHGVNGWLVPVRAVDEFAARISHLMNDPEMLRLVGDRAHHDVLARFGMARMTQSYHGLFSSLVEKEGIDANQSEIR
jgi:glycosyltransferase involved in cell wall biosynthesis